jgi:hypothetical protein
MFVADCALRLALLNRVESAIMKGIMVDKPPSTPLTDESLWVDNRAEVAARRASTPEQWARVTQNLAEQELASGKTPDDLRKLGLESLAVEMERLLEERERLLDPKELAAGAGVEARNDADYEERQQRAAEQAAKAAEAAERAGVRDRVGKIWDKVQEDPIFLEIMADLDEFLSKFTERFDEAAKIMLARAALAIQKKYKFKPAVALAVYLIEEFPKRGKPILQVCNRVFGTELPTDVPELTRTLLKKIYPPAWEAWEDVYRVPARAERARHAQ